MVGRAAYDNPWHLVEIDPALFGEPAPATSREDVAEALAEYVDRHVAEGGRAHHALRHFFNLYAGQPGARTWRRILTEEGRHPEATGDVVRRAQRERLEAG
jgi:tRNA-dihydrouridine synthase A